MEDAAPARARTSSDDAPSEGPTTSIESTVVDASAPEARPDTAGEAHGDEGDEEIADDASRVPAGTWAGPTESDTPPPPKPFPDPDTRRIRRVTSSVALERTDTPRPVRRVAESVARGRSPGALAVADEPAQAATAAPHPGAEVVAFPGVKRPSEAAASVTAPATVAVPTPTPDAPASAPASAPARATIAATASTSGLRANVASGEMPAVHAAPRWLASELLRESIPTTPYGRTSRVVALSAGTAGAALVALLGGETGFHLGMAALLATIAVLALVPIAFPLRAGAFAVLGTLGLVATTTLSDGVSGNEAHGIATLGTTLLAAAQLLRVVIRRSRFARVAMGVGLAISTGWLLLGGGLSAMVVHGVEFEHWVGPLTRALLMIVLALSLLGFLDRSGDSGCRVWPWLVLSWNLLAALAAVGLGTSPSPVEIATSPLFAAVAALGWMQVWVTTPGLGVSVSRVKGEA